MKKANLDSLIMLLSTDWFLPYWFVIGIGMEEEKRVLLQNDCREIVKQILSEEAQYWLASFSDDRTDKTHSMFQASLQKYRVDRPTTARINALTRGEDISKLDQATGWLVLSITEQVLKDSLQNGPQLETGTRDALVKVWQMANRSDLPQINFELVCLNSESEWDLFIRKTTPELPTRLADYASAIASTDKFELFWAAINSNLSTSERRKLLDWYRMVAESMTGEPLRLPQEA